MALLNSLIKLDAKICYSSVVKVYTSNRTEGRVEIGFSEQLKKWEDLKNKNVMQTVESDTALLIKMQCKNMLKNYFEKSCNKISIDNYTKIIANKLMINANWLYTQIKNAIYFGGLWQAIELEISKGEFYKTHPFIPITKAITNLRIFLNQHQSFSKRSNL
jgi:hypothetical protein